ncbi:MAG TPA: leucine-rich repeat protein [Verrucomicrobiae bacterium]
MAEWGRRGSRPYQPDVPPQSCQTSPGWLQASIQRDFSWWTNDGTISIVGYNGPGGEVTIPSTITDLPVRTFASYAFSGRTTVTSVTIPDSVRSIDYRSFANCTSFGVRTNQFGFSIAWAGGMTVVVEGRANLATSGWLPLKTNTLSADTFYFSDPDWSSYGARFYRICSP